MRKQYISIKARCQCDHPKWRHRCVNGECDSCYISGLDKGCKQFKLDNVKYFERLSMNKNFICKCGHELKRHDAPAATLGCTYGEYKNYCYCVRFQADNLRYLEQMSHDKYL